MTDETIDLWEERALPLLRYIAAHEAEMRFITIGEFAEATGIDPSHVVVELERLTGDGYIPGHVEKMATGGDPKPWFLVPVARLTGRGARAVSIWPRAEGFIQALESRAAAESEPERKRALTALLAAAQTVGTQVVAEVLSSAARRSMGLP